SVACARSSSAAARSTPPCRRYCAHGASATPAARCRPIRACSTSTTSTGSTSSTARWPTSSTTTPSPRASPATRPAWAGWPPKCLPVRATRIRTSATTGWTHCSKAKRRRPRCRRRGMPAPRPDARPPAGPQDTPTEGSSMHHSPLLLQLVVILAVARGCGLLLRHVGQPPVIGEMAAGLLLGPIVFGAWFPDIHAGVFAPESLSGLSSLSMRGLVLFMFIVGVELRAPDGVRAQFKAAGWVGVLSVLVPMGLGIAVAPALHPLAPAGVGFWPFALFMAAAMSITAFPILARILKERDMTHTRLGRLSLGG